MRACLTAIATIFLFFTSTSAQTPTSPPNPAPVSIHEQTSLAKPPGQPDAGARDTESPPEREDVLKLMELLGTAQMMNQFLDEYFGNLAKQQTEAPPEIWKEAAAEVKRTLGSEVLSDGLVAIYRQHLTAAEVRQLIAFYSSPLGAKLIRTVPVMMVESLQMAKRTAAGLTPRINEVVGRKLAEKKSKTGASNKISASK